MKHNKHIHDEDYDINIKLMVPLLSILVCTICLCATTWAWYTASVSTGVNSIVAGVNATVTAKIGELDAPLNNGAYTLGQGETLTLKFKGENAANGYYALIDITNQTTNTSASENALRTLFSLFVNRVYAENKNATDIQKCVYFSNEKTIAIKNNDTINKQVTITIVWANQSVDENGRHTLDQSYTGYQTVEENTVTIGSNTKVLVAHFYDIETQKPLPSESSQTETYNLEETKESGLVDVYEFEGTICEVKAPEGYMIVVKNEQGEDSYVESVVYDNLPEEETTDVTIFCISKEKLNTENIETPSEPADVPEEGSIDIETTDSINNQTTDTEETASNNSDINNENTSSSEGSTESTTETDTSESSVPPVDENNSETSEDGSSNLSTSNSENQATPEQETEISTNNTVESLLITETTSDVETSSETQSTDSSSSTDTSSETETNVSE